MHDDLAPDASKPLRSELEALRETAERHRRLLETTDTGFVVLDEAGRVLDANAVYVGMTGHETLDQIAGRPVTDWTAPEDLERNAEEVRRCAASGRVRNLVVDYLGPNGRRTPVEVNATVRNAATGPTILTVCRDISERRQAEEALRNSERRYRTTIDSLVDAIHVVDADLRIRLLNTSGEQWLRGLGITDDIVGRRISEVFPFLPQEVEDEYRRVFAGEGPLVTRETNTIDGYEVSTETRKIPIEEGDRVVRVVTVIRDVTTIVQAQEKLHQTEKMEALGQLAGGIAHDFNNQMTAVLGYAELIAQGIEGPVAKRHAATIARVAERCADLTRQLLAFARKANVRSVPVDIHATLCDVSAMLGRTIDPRIAIRLRLGAPRATVIGDPAQLQSAFLNLALNARDAMPDGGTLTFETSEAPNERLQIRVTDTGIGMGDEVRRRIFQPFFTTKDPGRGTGLGLSAVYGTVTHHGGEIQVESEPGTGSRFTMLLPLARDAALPEPPAASEPAQPKQAHVLVADDEPAVLQVTALMLSALGYRVTQCADGRAAVNCYRTAWRTIDLVLLDVMMPSLGGAGALIEMRQMNPQVRAILFSGHPLGAAEHALVDQGAAAFLPKPFTRADLARVVASAIAG